MSKTDIRDYKTTFILDLRDTEDDSSKVIDDVSEILKSLGASVDSGEDLGLKEFARAADRRFAQGHYVEVYFSGGINTPSELKEKLRLDKRINRIFVESD